MSRSLLLPGLLIFVAVLPRASAQVVTRISQAVTCTRCTIAVSTIATLGNDDGFGSFAAPRNAVRVDQRGRYWVIGGPDPPVLFDERGRSSGPLAERGKVLANSM